MSGSYERASTIGFRCVADSKDDCGTDGKLCIRQYPKPETVTHGIDKRLTVQAVVADSKSDVWRISNASIGSNGLHFLGASAGFIISAPAASTKRYSTLRLHVGSVLGARGNLTASTAAHTKSLTIWPQTALLTFKYQDGPMQVQYRADEGTVCSNTQLCLKSSTPTCPPRVPMLHCVADLSIGAVDWAHWGSTNITQVSGTDAPATSMADVTVRKASGPAALVATILMPGCSTDACNANASDLKTVR